MTPLLGASYLGPDGWRTAQSWARLKGAGSAAQDTAPAYWWYGAQAGLRPEVLFAHSCKETNFYRFGGVLDASFHNCAGIKTKRGGGDYDPNAHERFPSWPEGVRAHVNHMLAYVHGRDARFIGEPHGRASVVQSTSWAGTVRHVEDLNGRWAPSATYGDDLVRLFLNPLMRYPREPTMRIVTREEWGARPPESVKRIATPTRELWLHHSATEQHGAEGVRAIQRYHMDVRGWSDIAYSFLVDDTGVVYEGRGVGVAGAHTENHNSISHGICAIGNYDARQPTRGLLTSLRNLILHGRQHGWWGELSGGHRDTQQTACPGGWLYAEIPTLRTATPGGTHTSDTLLESQEEDLEAQFLLGLYEAYLNRRPGTATWDVAAFDHNLGNLLNGRVSKEDLRVKFAESAGL